MYMQSQLCVSGITRGCIQESCHRKYGLLTLVVIPGAVDPSSVAKRIDNVFHHLSAWSGRELI
jgi:hypothetical protein